MRAREYPVCIPHCGTQEQIQWTLLQVNLMLLRGERTVRNNQGLLSAATQDLALVNTHPVTLDVGVCHRHFQVEPVSPALQADRSSGWAWRRSRRRRWN